MSGADNKVMPVIGGLRYINQFNMNLFSTWIATSNHSIAPGLYDGASRDSQASDYRMWV